MPEPQHLTVHSGKNIHSIFHPILWPPKSVFKLLILPHYMPLILLYHGNDLPYYCDHPLSHNKSNIAGPRIGI